MPSTDGDEPKKPPQRKLIEVALPLEAVNRESAREKSIRHGHPSTLHLWWARRPLAAARAVLFAQLVDDPSSHPDRFPSEEAQQEERKRLHGIIERLVVWENTSDRALFKEAHQEILNSTDGTPPPILDPFAGGGTIPLEAQRLGLEAHASDLNPVAVLINKALIEIPPKFADQRPVFPGLAGERTAWEGASGLAADVQAYGEWMRNEAKERIGRHYPVVELTDGTAATAIAWIWARTATCPNPDCGATTPLVNSFDVCSKKGRHMHVVPVIESKVIAYRVAPGRSKVDGTISRSGARCLVCQSAISLNELRSQGQDGRMGRDLLCMVAEGSTGRLYVSPTAAQVATAEEVEPTEFPDAPLPERSLGFRVQRYGLNHQRDLYTARQQLLLTTLSSLSQEARNRAIRDGATQEYADALLAYLALLIGRVANRSSSQSFWDPGREGVQQVFARNALPMIWTYAESNPFSESSGNVLGQLRYLVAAIKGVPGQGRGEATQRDAQVAPRATWAVSTDPPYYDNVPYAALSDFFYVWHRRVLRDVYPSLYETAVTPKADELIAEPARHSSPADAAAFFEGGMARLFESIVAQHPEEMPFTIYYAFKQTEQDGQSTGWETLLQALVEAGGMITATWPIRTELSGGLRQLGRNSLASSVVLTARARRSDAPTTDRRGFNDALLAELPRALRLLQQGAVSPVDLPQAAIGPGMSVFSRYAKVIEGDGSPMRVRAALARINEVLDEVLSEQEGDFDGTTRFAIAWYRHKGYEEGKFGDADNMARARNTSVGAMARDGILESVAGDVALLAPEEYEDDYDPVADDRVSAWEVLHSLIAALDRDGLPKTGALLARAEEREDGAIDLELLKELAFLLFSIAEKNGWTNDAISFNKIATAWPEIVAESSSASVPDGTQGELDLEGED